jgi:alpha-galactosidase
MEGGTQQDGLVRYWKISRSEETAEKKLRRKGLSSITLYKLEKLSEEND